MTPADENHDLRKQIGCINGIFQLFARRHFHASRNISSHHHKRRLLLGAQQQLETHNARKTVREKDPKAQKTKLRVSSGSSQDSNSPSSSSSKHSSLDYNRQISTPKSPSQITAMKEQKHSLTKGQQSPDIRDLVKDSMYREARFAPIKTSANDERKLKHTDSPRPAQQSKSGTLKASVYEGKMNSKDEWLTLPHFSYDERESRDVVKTNIMIKERPRFSLDSKASLIKCSTLYSRLNFLSRDENENSLQVSPVNQESGNHCRSNSLVAKLMGLDAFPDPRHNRENSAQKKKARCRTPRNNNMQEANEKTLFMGKKITCRNLVVERISKAPQRIQVNSTTPTRRLGMVSPTVRYIVAKTEKESDPNRSTSESSRFKKQTSKKVGERCPHNRIHISTDLQLNDEQLSNHSCETRYSCYHGDTASTKSEHSNSITSHTETEVISSANSISINPREQDYITTSKEHMPAVKDAVGMMEQPSPVSVLDTPFYGEGSPSPIKKIPTAFQEPSPDEAEWHLENLNHIKCDFGYKYNQKSENQLHFIHEPRLLKTEANETASDHGIPSYQSINQGHRCLTKIQPESGLLKDTSIIRTANQLHSSCFQNNYDTYHVIQATEDLMKKAIEALIEKEDQLKLNHIIQRKIVSDIIDEIMACKMTSRGLLNLGTKRASLQGLIKDVYLEMDHFCQQPYCNLIDEDDYGSLRLLTADMKYQSDDWTDYGGELPALVLDIERLIFKDLINEVITCEIMGLLDWPKLHCRQLFTK